VPGGAQVPITKGKLTIRVAEARGIKDCANPYTVVVFQRNELISQGNRHDDGDDAASDDAAADEARITGDTRHGSGSAMAIPMRSRQSSNTSTNDNAAIRRAAAHSSTDLRLEAEAVL
jgi:protein-serine/threonine kinase